MADLPDTEERLRILESLLFFLLTPAGRDDPEWRRFRDFLLHSEISPKLRAFLRDQFIIAEPPQFFQERERRLTAIEQRLSAMQETISSMQRSDVPQFREWDARLKATENRLSLIQEVSSESAMRKLTIDAKIARREALEALLVLSQSKIFENERFLRVVPCSIH